MPDEREIVALIMDKLRRVNVCLPGSIESYDASERKASVKILLDEKYADETVLSGTVVPNVPVVMPSTQNAGLVLPIGTGDYVMLVFSQRSLDRWLSEGGTTEPDDARMHSLNDAIAIVGLFPFKTTHSDGDGVRLHNNDTELRLEDEEAQLLSGGLKLELASGKSIMSAATVPEVAALTAKIQAQNDGKIAMGTSTVELLDEVIKVFDEIIANSAAWGAPVPQTIISSAALKTIKGAL